MTRRLFIALLASAAVWLALVVAVPAARQGRVFSPCPDVLGDFLYPRLCAEMPRTYAGEPDETRFAALKREKGWCDGRFYALAKHLGKAKEWTDGFPDVLRPVDCCYPPLSVLFTRLFPISLGGALVCTLLGAALLLAALAVCCRGRNALLVVSALLLSAPLLQAVERGQLVLYSAAGVALFLAWYDSPSRARRLAAMLALAVATVLKVSPALFACLYLTPSRDMFRWESLRRPLAFALVTAVLFFVPFAFVGGMEAFTDWLANAAANSAEYTRCGQWGLLRFQRAFLVARGISVQTPWPSLPYVHALDVLFGLIVLFFGWRRRDPLLLTGAMLLLPGNMLMYTGVYLLAPLVLPRPRPLPSALVFLLLVPLQLPVGPSSLSSVLADAAFLLLLGKVLLDQDRSVVSVHPSLSGK